MRWALVHKADGAAVALANRHYSRRRPASQVGPPARGVILRTPEGDALWACHASAIDRLDGYPTAWSNGYFRNESPHLASELILEALAATRHVLGDPPADGVITYVDPDAVKPNRRPGRVYERAGFELVGRTDPDEARKHGRPVLLRFRLAPELVPAAEPPLELALALFA